MLSQCCSSRSVATSRWRSAPFAAIHLYALAAILTMALALATATAIFAVIDATLIRPLPFADPDRLVSLNVQQPGPGGGDIQYVLSEIELVRWRDAAATLTGIEAFQPRSMALTGGGAEPAVVAGAAVTSGLFPTLGVMPALGRAFTADEEQRGLPVAIVGDALWRRRFGANPAALGQTITLDGRAFDVVGVMPPGFHPLLDASEAWIPLAPKINPANQNARITVGISRLRQGATTAGAEAELAPISARLAKEFPTGHARARPQVMPLRQNLLGDRTPALVALAAGVVLLLVLACANVANLTLGHFTARRSELAMRALLGASRRRVIQQQLVQCVVVTAFGGAAGVALAYMALPILVALSTRAGAPNVDCTGRLARDGIRRIRRARRRRSQRPVARAARAARGQQRNRQPRGVAHRRRPPRAAAARGAGRAPNRDGGGAPVRVRHADHQPRAAARGADRLRHRRRADDAVVVAAGEGTATSASAPTSSSGCSTESRRCRASSPPARRRPRSCPTRACRRASTPTGAR